MDEKLISFAEFSDFEAKEDGNVGIVEGYAAVFNNRDNGKDRITVGAFTKSLKARSAQIVYLPAHDHRIHVKDIPAVPLEIREDPKGLFTKTKFLLNTQAGRDSYEVLKAYQAAGRPIGLSFTYKVLDYDVTSQGRELKELELYEYGHCALPMNDLARTTGVKADGNYMMHSAEVDHSHAHGDTIHSHPHSHSTGESYSGMSHTYHDHTPEQLKSMGYDENMTTKYTSEQLIAMKATGEANESGTIGIKNFEDLQAALVSATESVDKEFVRKRATDLKLEGMIPADWDVVAAKSGVVYMSEVEVDNFIKDIQTDLGKTLSDAQIVQLKSSISTIQTVLGQSTNPEEKSEETEEVKVARLKDEREKLEMEEAITKARAKLVTVA